MPITYSDCQANSASDPRCYDSATCPCCNVGTCSSDGQCGGNCKDGYHGGKCWRRCPPNNCVRCVDASQGSGVSNCTQCKEGYYSTSTQYQCQLSCPPECRTCVSSTRCTSCIDGYYLTGFDTCNYCNKTCLTCNSSTVCTACKSGYFFTQGEGTCSKCSPLCSTCLSHDSCICSNGCLGNKDMCDSSTGSCSTGCKPNFNLGHLNRCDICRDGMTGYHCNNSCSQICVSTCDRITGVCGACGQGYYGDYCDKTCPQNCVTNCHRVTGNCLTCKEGYHGYNCTSKCQTDCKECAITDGHCITCSDGLYGTDCNRNCSEHCLVNRCVKSNGRCECAPGYEGGTCNMKVTTTPMFTTVDFFVVTQTPENIVGAAIGLTLAGAVVIAGVIGGIIVLYRRRKRTLLTESLPVMSFKAGTSDEAKLTAELESLDEKIATLDAKAATARARRAEVEAQLQDLDRHMPYRHTDRADIITDDNSYEMLQQQKQDEQGHYMTIKY